MQQLQQSKDLPEVFKASLGVEADVHGEGHDSCLGYCVPPIMKTPHLHMCPLRMPHGSRMPHSPSSPPAQLVGLLRSVKIYQFPFSTLRLLPAAPDSAQLLQPGRPPRTAFCFL